MSEKTAGNFNANVPTAKIVVTFLNSERPPVNIESPSTTGTSTSTPSPSASAAHSAPTR
jgi:hypothetical protein